MFVLLQWHEIKGVGHRKFITWLNHVCVCLTLEIIGSLCLSRRYVSVSIEFSSHIFHLSSFLAWNNELHRPYECVRSLCECIICHALEMNLNSISFHYTAYMRNVNRELCFSPNDIHCILIVHSSIIFSASQESSMLTTSMKCVLCFSFFVSASCFTSTILRMQKVPSWSLELLLCNNRSRVQITWHENIDEANVEISNKRFDVDSKNEWLNKLKWNDEALRLEETTESVEECV